MRRLDALPQIFMISSVAATARPGPPAPYLFRPTAMHSRIFSSFVLLGSVLLASCYPYDEGRRRPERPAPNQASITSPEQQQIQAQRERLAREQAAANAATRPTQPRPNLPTPPPQIPTNPTPTPPAPAPAPQDYGYAVKVPGKEGFVLSPFNNKEIDVRGIASGKLVRDPTYPEEEKKWFRVP